MLELRNLTKCFGGLTAVDGLDLSIGQGETVGLIGPNGAGKTTIFNLITGFLRPTRGKIIFEGEDITGQKPHSIAKKGMVRTFQTITLFPDFTVLQNAIAACYLNPEFRFWEAALHTSSYRKKEEAVLSRALILLKFAELDDVKDMPVQILPHMHKSILSIAIALAAEPKLLLLDEPLGGMSAEEVAAAIAFMNKIRQRGTTIILIEHNVRAAMSLCQRVVVVDFGKKIAEGSPEEIRQNKKVIQAYLGAIKHAA
jgi:branched-chain amino acid transport system ATP-binding protein